MAKAKSVSEWFETVEPDMAPIATALRDAIETADPGLSTKLAWGFPCWSGTERVFSIVAHAAHCNLQLWYGAKHDEVTAAVSWSLQRSEENPKTALGLDLIQTHFFADDADTGSATMSPMTITAGPQPIDAADSAEAPSASTENGEGHDGKI